MSLRIAIPGASGQSAACSPQLLPEDLLAPNDTPMLVGHGTFSGRRRLLSVKTDLLDAFDDRWVHIDVVPDITDFEADIAIVAAGAAVCRGTQR